MTLLILHYLYHVSYITLPPPIFRHQAYTRIPFLFSFFFEKYAAHAYCYIRVHTLPSQRVTTGLICIRAYFFSYFSFYHFCSYVLLLSPQQVTICQGRLSLSRRPRPCLEAEIEIHPCLEIEIEIEINIPT